MSNTFIILLEIYTYKSTNICLQGSLFHCLESPKRQKNTNDIKRALVIVSETIKIKYIFLYELDTHIKMPLCNI